MSEAVNPTEVVHAIVGPFPIVRNGEPDVEWRCASHGPNCPIGVAVNKGMDWIATEILRQHEQALDEADVDV